ncbi:MAG: homoserine kinase, partial [Methylotenera sp.]
MTAPAADAASHRHAARAFAPASVGNIGVGFDLLGHAIDGPRDIAIVRRIDAPEVRIAAIRGDVAGVDALPLEAERNTAGRALIALREALGLAYGFEVELEKGIPLGSGLGGSAASCVAALVAANAVLDTPLSRDALYPFALQGEAVASGSMHGDNVAPMLLGGVVLATQDRMIPLQVPAWLYCVVVHPDQMLETRRARAALSEPYPLSQFVEQSTHLALWLPQSGVLVNPTDNAVYVARVNFLREEPGGGLNRFFVCDLNGKLYILDHATKQFATYLDFQRNTAE